MMGKGFWRASVSGLAAAAISNFASTSAFAVCAATNTAGGSGPPSISATEASTAQALEILQRRKDEAGGVDGVMLASAESFASDDGSDAEAPGESSQSASGQPGAPKVKKKKKISSGQDVSMTSQGSDSGGWRKTKGAWALGYADYERNSDVNIGLRDTDSQDNSGATRSKDDVTVEKKQRSGGMLAGMDWTTMSTGPVRKGTQYGFFAGYDRTHSTFSDGSFAAYERQDAAPATFSEEFFQRLGAEETTEAGMLGLYGAVFQGNWSLDTALKIDIGNLEHEHTTRKLFCANEIAFKRGDVDYVDYALNANLAYLHPLSAQTWIQPLVGVRYTFTDFSDATGNLVVGAENGHVLRLQAGATVGGVGFTPQGYIVTTNFTGLVYSDVLIDGFVGNTGINTTGGANTAADLSVDSASLNDEGKVRVLGQISSIIDFRNGYSLLGQVETRGGDDYFGIGGRLGVRYEW